MRTIKQARLFFALWPDDEVRYQVAENLRRLNIDGNSVRFVANRNLHMTLHFIGNTSRAEIKCLNGRARLVNAEPVELILNCSGFFKKPRVFWFGCRDVPNTLYNLHTRLGQQISRCAFRPESRPYSPHLTVARKIVEAPGYVAFKPVNWKVQQFVLVESRSTPEGVSYQVVESYPLTDRT